MFETEGKSVGTWSSFGADSTYFEGNLMINFRVDDAEGLVAALKAKGADVLDRSDDSELGEFAGARRSGRRAARALPTAYLTT